MNELKSENLPDLLLSFIAVSGIIFIQKRFGRDITRSTESVRWEKKTEGVSRTSRKTSVKVKVKHFFGWYLSASRK